MNAIQKILKIQKNLKFGPPKFRFFRIDINSILKILKNLKILKIKGPGLAPSGLGPSRILKNHKNLNFGGPIFEFLEFLEFLEFNSKNSKHSKKINFWGGSIFRIFRIQF